MIMSKYIAYPYYVEEEGLYCIVVYEDNFIEYYHYKSFQEAKEQYLFWTNDKYFKKIYFKKK